MLLEQAQPKEDEKVSEQREWNRLFVWSLERTN